MRHMNLVMAQLTIESLQLSGRVSEPESLRVCDLIPCGDSELFFFVLHSQQDQKASVSISLLCSKFTIYLFLCIKHLDICKLFLNQKTFLYLHKALQKCFGGRVFLKSYSVAFLNLFHDQPSTEEEKAKIGICKYDYTVLSDLLFSNTTDKLVFIWTAETNSGSTPFCRAGLVLLQRMTVRESNHHTS